MDKTYFLTQEQKEFYNENGYLVIKKLFDIDTLEILRQRFLEYCNGKVKHPAVLLPEPALYKKSLDNPEDYINKIQELNYDEVFQRYSENPRLLHIISQLIGRGLTVLNTMLINKPPRSPCHPAHQDMYYIPIRPYDVVGTWTAVDPATVDNGCLWCVPGSHKGLLLPHGRHSRKFYHTISDEEKYAPLAKRIYLAVEPGDTVFIHPLLIHGSGPNDTTRHRKAVSSHFMNNRSEYISMEGTVQEPLIKDYEEFVPKNFPHTLQDHWRVKSKLVQPTPSHL